MTQGEVNLVIVGALHALCDSSRELWTRLAPHDPLSRHEALREQVELLSAAWQKIWLQANTERETKSCGE